MEFDTQMIAPAIVMVLCERIGLSAEDVTGIAFVVATVFYAIKGM